MKDHQRILLYLNHFLLKVKKYSMLLTPKKCSLLYLDNQILKDCLITKSKLEEEETVTLELRMIFQYRGVTLIFRKLNRANII